MSWSLAAFALLAVALGAGFAWYERTRPDARIVALVGTLAAFAALGRIAFAAVPNVKPTTDIVLIAGFALGAGPGFAVGATAGLASNFFFGQGPWTPWQMAAWGATGALGALLARLARRRDGERSIGRWALALVCLAAGFAFTAAQDAGDWVTYSDHSLAQLGAYVGQGLGFDAIHAAGCLLFALAFGPALLRSIQRFARRIEVRWIPPVPPAAAVALVTVAVAALLGSHASQAGASPDGLVQRSVSYLRGAENADGGFGAAPGQPSAQLFAGWAALGLAAAGESPDRLRRGRGLLAYVRAGAGTRDVGALERTILVVRAAGLNAAGFGGRNLVSELIRRFGADGAVSAQVNLTAFGLMALRAAGSDPALQVRAARWLVAQQDRDGGFGFAGRGGASDVDDTGAVLEALAGSPAPHVAAVRRRAIAYLRRAQDGNGGFPSQPGMGSNAQSTAWAIQGLIAAGVNPDRVRRGGRAPTAYLRSLIAPDGSVRYARGQAQTPVWVTGEALMALAGKPLPLAPPARPGPSPRPLAPSARARHSGRGSHPRPRRTRPHATPRTRAARPHRAARSRATARPRRRQRAPRSSRPGVAAAVARMEAWAAALPSRIVASVRLGAERP